jgi:hypothetical protein
VLFTGSEFEYLVRVNLLTANQYLKARNVNTLTSLVRLPELCMDALLYCRNASET